MRFAVLIMIVSSLMSTPTTAAAGQASSSTVYTRADGVSLPEVVKDVKAEYAPEAKKARIQGTVRLECVVLADGTVGDVRVVEPLDPALDQEAIKALKQWRFSPGKKEGRPV